jgi:hypothetical protein
MAREKGTDAFNLPDAYIGAYKSENLGSCTS